MTPTTSSMKECIDVCFECHRVCLETIQYCLKQGGKHVEPSHIQLLQNCASICETNAQFLIAGSELHPTTCQACSEVCQRCAEDCEKFQGDAQMKRCAEVCRRCADSCAQMGGRRVAA